MANSSIPSENTEVGVIILGNCGAGKSFICNLLLGQEKCTVAFQSEAVTTTTTSHRLTHESSNLLIYDVPGLIEPTLQNIDRNVEEIKKAFRQSHPSYVVFVLAHISGRIQDDDIIAFNALKEAYQFPPGCLMFVLNNIPAERLPVLESNAILTLKRLVPNMEISSENLMFLPKLNENDKESITKIRINLLNSILARVPCSQTEKTELIVQHQRIKQLQEALKKQREQDEKEIEDQQRILAEMNKQHEAAMENRNADLRDMVSQINVIRSRMNENGHFDAGSCCRSKVCWRNEELWQRVMKLRNNISGLDKRYTEKIDTLTQNHSRLQSEIEKDFRGSLKTEESDRVQKACQLFSDFLNEIAQLDPPFVT